MSAEIIILPLIHRPASNAEMIYVCATLETSIFSRLEAAAELAGSTPERMAEALIVWGLASIERKTPEEFYETYLPSEAAVAGG